MGEQRFDEALGRFVDCEKCTSENAPGPAWERASVALGHPEFAALFGTVMRVGDGVMRGQLLVAWELNDEAHSQDWRHVHEVSLMKVSVDNLTETT